MKQLIDDIEGLLIFFFVVIFPLFYLFQNTCRSYEYHKELEKRGVTATANFPPPFWLGGGKTATAFPFVFKYQGEIDTGYYTWQTSRIRDIDREEQPFLRNAEVIFLPEMPEKAIFKIDLYYFNQMMWGEFWPFFTGNSFWLSVLAICFIIYMSLGLYALKRDRKRNGSIPPTSD
ncbi:MAG: hypothetical protein JNL95_01830 [Chitinophagales bacterium]|nr:hypothetical protein [Chitinophagales bacterium]